MALYDGDFRPSYTETHTAEGVVREFGITWKGPGWYHAKHVDAYKREITDTMLVMVVDPDKYPWTDGVFPWAQTWPPETLYFCFVWNGRDPAHIFNRVVNAPTRA